MKIHKCTQGTDEWFKLRAGLITASGASKLLTPLFKVKDGKAVDTYLAEKLAEKWLGDALPSDKANTFSMEAGQVWEKEARNFLSAKMDVDIETVGLITNDAETYGCSPDGFISGDGHGLELKCPQIETHTKYLLSKTLPEQYVVQVHFSMFVTGAPSWTFMSYRRGMPPFILEVRRDEKAISSIFIAVNEFLEKMDDGWKTLIDLNGGRLPVRQKTVAEVLAEENFDTAP